MNATHLRAADFTRRPWRNGGGFTTELAVHAEGGQWIWRLSVAEVAQSGPFSDFSGYERTILLVEGAGMELAIDGRAPVLLRDASPPFTFDGGAATACTLLDGPVRDLNLMVERRRFPCERKPANSRRRVRHDLWGCRYGWRRPAGLV